MTETLNPFVLKKVWMSAKCILWSRWLNILREQTFVNLGHSREGPCPRMERPHGGSSHTRKLILANNAFFQLFLLARFDFLEKSLFQLKKGYKKRLPTKIRKIEIKKKIGLDVYISFLSFRSKQYLNLKYYFLNSRKFIP